MKVREYNITINLFGFIVEGEPTGADILDYLNDTAQIEGPDAIEFNAEFVCEKEL